MAETEDYDKSATPTAHKTSHQDGGSDEISGQGLSGLLANAQTPLAHKTSHQSGGSDIVDADTLDTKHYSNIYLDIDTKIGVHSGEADPHTPYLLAAGTRILGGDWDIGAGRIIQAEKIQARSNLGLSLLEDGGRGIFIKDGGNVGIGSPNPPGRLEAGDSYSGETFPVADAQVQFSIRQIDATCNTWAGLAFRFGTDNVVYGAVAAQFNYATNEADLTFHSTEMTVSYERMRITRLGNVGLGKVVVNYKLDVAGDINIDSGHVFRVNATQVVGTRVIDDRIDDVIEAGLIVEYPLAAGILDAIRNAQIAHGLIAAA